MDSVGRTKLLEEGQELRLRFYQTNLDQSIAEGNETVLSRPRQFLGSTKTQPRGSGPDLTSRVTQDAANPLLCKGFSMARPEGLERPSF